MLTVIKVFIICFFGIPLTGAILFLVAAADAMKRDEEAGKAQVRARRMRLEVRRAQTLPRA